MLNRYVLGLSQGTVSELLSKPKSWDKLTEKGRDSYRKMHAWCYDDAAIMLLKSLIPRKGELVRPLSSSPLVLHCEYSSHELTPSNWKKAIIIFSVSPAGNLHTSGLFITLRDNSCLSEVCTRIISCHWYSTVIIMPGCLPSKWVSHNCYK